MTSMYDVAQQTRRITRMFQKKIWKTVMVRIIYDQLTFFVVDGGSITT